MMYQDLTKGKIGKTLILFALPMMAGNFLQQFYNIADTLIVGRVLGRNALAAVGSAYTLMTFLSKCSFIDWRVGSGMIIFQYLHSLLYKVRKFLKAERIHIISLCFRRPVYNYDIAYR